jgi:hypothetical protein
MKAEKVVLCVSDTTDLNYDHLDHCEGLGVIGQIKPKQKPKDYDYIQCLQ